MPSRATVNVSAWVDLPSVLQSLAAARRAATVQVRCEQGVRWLYLAEGGLQAIGGVPSGRWLRAIGWARFVTSEELARLGRELAEADPETVWQRVCAETGMPESAALEPLTILAYEEVDEVLGWPAPEFDIVEQAPADPFVDFQRRFRLLIAVPALLLEILRRQDERARNADLIPDPWDVLCRIGDDDGRDEDAAQLLARCRHAMVYRELIDHPAVPPFRAQRAVVALRRANCLRVAAANELVAFAERVRAARPATAYGILQRAVALGQDGLRVRWQLADLAEQLGNAAEAAQHCLSAAEQATAASDQIQALERALRLGAAPEPILGQLVSLYLVQGDDRRALESLFALVRWYEERGMLARALEVLSESQQLGADPVVTGMAIGRLAAALGDHEQAAIHYEQCARLAAAAGRQAEALQAWLSLASLQPERLEPARAAAELLLAAGRHSEAAALLRRALAQATQVADDARLAAWELLAKAAPEDSEANDWLAKAYARRRDSERATQQLRLVAERQEREGDDIGLVSTLERIVVLGGEDAEIQARLAAAHERLGQIEAAIDAWCRAIDLARESGQQAFAERLAQAAVQRAPASVPLRQRLAELALRAGDRGRAARELRHLADLASGSGDLATATEALTRLLALRPEDLPTRLRLVELLHDANDPGEAAAVADALRLATRRADYGTASELARRRLALAAPEERYHAAMALIELLRRAGDAAGERAAVQALLDELLGAGDMEHAIALLSAQVAAHSKDAAYALSLAEATAGIGDRRTAARCYRHAAQLLQSEGRIAEAEQALQQLAEVSDDALLVQAARRALAAGEPIDWERLRQAVTQDQRRGFADQLGAADRPA
ncbi:MAG: DUF4388 domain-containing protein [Planctomycetes bacterium]|nr:DUF4388 domain-containing protein [Planctomycetota bacterium]